MATPDPSSTPSSYALEKAVRVAARKLGRGASVDAIEKEALRELASEGFVSTAPPAHQRPHAVPPATHTKETLLHVSISAAPCVSRRPSTQKARLYDVLRKNLLKLPADIRATTCVHVRDTSSLFVGHDPDVLDDVIETLGHAAADTAVPQISGPFIDAALPENLPFVERLPDALGNAPRISPIIQVSTPDNGISESVVEALTYALALIRPSSTGSGLILLTTNDCDRRAFGHRVHAETIVVHRRNPIHTPPGNTRIPLVPESWMNVHTADLPLTAEYPSDHVFALPSGIPTDIFRLMDDALFAGLASGGRRQLAFVY